MATDEIATANLDALVQFAQGGIVSKTFLERDRVKLVLFCMAAGQQLSEHTAGMPAIIHVLSGRAVATLEQQVHEAGPGDVLYMPAGTVHAVEAKDDLVFLLTLLRG